MRTPVLIASLLLIGACASNPPLSDTVPEVAEGYVVRLPFLTNRNLMIDENQVRSYGNSRGVLGAGVCSVLLEDPEKPRGQARVIGVQEVSPQEVLGVGAKRALYVHGYNIGFAKGCRRAAQLAHNSGLEERLLLFSWPADGNALNYVGDVADMEWSVAELTRTLQAFGESAEAVDLIGHSLGARGLVAALVNVARAGESPPRFGRLILTGADIDAEVFQQDLTYLAEVVSGITIYVSRRDRALVMSNQLHGYPRLGQTPIEPAANVEVVDVSEVTAQGFSGHHYHIYHPGVLEDLRQVLGLPEGERLYERSGGSGSFQLQMPAE